MRCQRSYVRVISQINTSFFGKLEIRLEDNYASVKTLHPTYAKQCGRELHSRLSYIGFPCKFWGFSAFLAVFVDMRNK